jgi:WD40 repeat protein
MRTLEGHRAEVWCVDLNQDRVVSGSVDSTVGIYDLETGARLHLLTHHASSVFGVQLYEQCLLTGSKDGSAHLFDIR